MTDALTAARREYYARITDICKAYAADASLNFDLISAMEKAAEEYDAALKAWVRGEAA